MPIGNDSSKTHCKPPEILIYLFFFPLTFPKAINFFVAIKLNYVNVLGQEDEFSFVCLGEVYLSALNPFMNSHIYS